VVIIQGSIRFHLITLSAVQLTLLINSQRKLLNVFYYSSSLSKKVIMFHWW